MRELRNHGGDVLSRVEKGESVVVTRDGVPVGELRPLPGRDGARRPCSPGGGTSRAWMPRRSGSPTRRGPLDTSAVIASPLLRGEHGLPEEPLIASITLAELSVGPLVAASERERADRQPVLQQAEADVELVPFDAAAARAFGRLAASLRRAGRTPQTRAYDALIAAVAIARDLPVKTCNPATFGASTGCRSSPSRYRSPDASAV